MDNPTSLHSGETGDEAAGYPQGIGRFIAEEIQRTEELEPELAFEPSEYRDRLSRLRQAMVEAKIDILVITAPDATAWLHGLMPRFYAWHCSTQFPAEFATLVHVENDPVIYIDQAMHAEIVRRTSVVTDFRPLPEMSFTSYSPLEAHLDFLIDQLRLEGWHTGTVGMEHWSALPNPAVAQKYREMLVGAGYEVMDATSVIRGVRRLKSPAELRRITQAQRAADHGIRTVQYRLQPGMSEYDAHAMYLQGVMAGGGEQSAIHDSVYAGPPEFFGHAFSSRTRRFESSDYLHIDGAASSAGYHARACRPLIFEPPRIELQRLADICAGAYEVLTTTAEVGLPFRELDLALVEYFRQCGIDEEIGFGGGYELGLSVNPDYVGEFVWGTGYPDLGGVIEAGLVTNFESCAYLAVIDTVVFEESGTRTLSELPLEILPIGS